MEILGDNWNQQLLYGRIKTEPVWALKHRALPYSNEPFNDEASVAKWRDQGYTQTKFTGDMYDMRNDEPEWMSAVLQQFPWQYLSWSLYRMGPGTVLPEHSDTYVKFKKIYNIDDTATIRRAIIFLEDWQSGHYIEIAGIPIVNWRAGDGIFWNNDTPHIAANVGSTDRYTLQLTGMVPFWRKNV